MDPTLAIACGSEQRLMFIGDKMTRFFFGLAIIFWCCAALADPMVPSGGGGAVVNIPPPTVDWYARAISGIALLVAVAAFVWGRFDKYHERKEALAEKQPVVDLDITGFKGAPLNYELRIQNRADVSVALLSISCSRGTLTSDEGEVSRDGMSIDYNGQRIAKGAENTFVGELRPPRGGGSAEFVVRIQVNDHDPYVHEVRLKRNLRA